MSLVPYQAPYQAGLPVAQPIIPTAVVPGYVGANTALDYYGNPVLSGYDYGSGGLGYRGLGYRGRGYYPRKRGRLSRMMEALFLGSETDRLRSIELQHEMGMTGLYPGGYSGYGLGMAPGVALAPGMAMAPGYGMSPYSLGARALIDDPYLLPMRGGMYGMRCSIPHRRGLTCPECDDYYM